MANYGWEGRKEAMLYSEQQVASCLPISSESFTLTFCGLMGIDGTKKQATSILPHTQISTT